MPLRYSQGISSSMLLVFRRYGGRIFEEKGSAASVGAAIVHPRLLDLDRADAGGDRPLRQVAVADHLAMAALVLDGARCASIHSATSASMAWVSIR